MEHSWVSSFQQIPKGGVTSGSGLEDDVPESDQVVLVSSSPPPGRRAEKLEQPALICPKDASIQRREEVAMATPASYRSLS